MIIKDIKGMYELVLEDKIVYEVLQGLYNDDDLNRLHNEYVTKIVPTFKGEIWTKCSDLRKYKSSNISQTATSHLDWCRANGMQPGAILVENPVVKMQMNRYSKNNSLTPMAFTELEEAKLWLKSKGF